MRITVQQGGIQEVAAEAIIINLFTGVKKPGGATGVVDQALNGSLSEIIAQGDFQGKKGETLILYPRGAVPAQRVIVVGLGAADTFDLEGVREAAAVGIKRARDLGAKNVATIIHGGGTGQLCVMGAAQAVVEGSMLALYRYDAPRKKQDEPTNIIESLTLVEFDEAKLSDIEAGAQAGQIIAESVYLARTLVNRPSNIMTPTALAKATQKMAAEVGLSCRILEESEMRAQEMGALLAVTQGAKEAAKFIVISHRPMAATGQEQPLVLIGKGVTFDTGGYTLKRAQGMITMKSDMAGAAAVIGAMRAVALLDLPYHVVGLVPTAENVIGSEAYRPGEVFTAKNGVSIEIISTDAEGRLLLADALCYADTLHPELVINVATLTGAKVVALGERMDALFCNDDVLSEGLIASGKQVGEPLWRMPLDEAYDEQLKSQVADLKNTGGRAAGAVTAARFLAHFVGDWPWAHLDIAGSALYSNSSDQTTRNYMVEGATGTPLRTFVEFLQRRDNG